MECFSLHQNSIKYRMMKYYAWFVAIQNMRTKATKLSYAQDAICLFIKNATTLTLFQKMIGFVSCVQSSSMMENIFLAKLVLAKEEQWFKQINSSLKISKYKPSQMEKTLFSITAWRNCINFLSKTKKFLFKRRKTGYILHVIFIRIRR